MIRNAIIAAILAIGVSSVSAQTIPQQVGQFPTCRDGDRLGDLCVWQGVDGDPRFHRISPDGTDLGPDKAGRLLAVIRSDNPQNPGINELQAVAYVNHWVVTVRVEQAGQTRYVVALDYSAPNVFPWGCTESVAETVCGPNLSSPYWDMPQPQEPTQPPTQEAAPPPESACVAFPELCGPSSSGG